MKSTSERKSGAGLAAATCSALEVTAICCHVRLTDGQESAYDRMMPPYDDDMAGWHKMEKELKALGAENLDHDFYGGFDFTCADRATAETIAAAILEKRPGSGTPGQRL